MEYFFIGMFFGVFLIDLCYSRQLVNSIRKFAQEKEIVVKHRELNVSLRRQAEKLKKVEETIKNAAEEIKREKEKREGGKE